LTGSAHDGDDLLQATCEQAIKHIHTWQKGSRLDSWMFRIARNLYLNERRARGVRDSHLRDVSHTQATSIDGQAALDSYLAYAAMRGHVARLPEEQRAALLLIAVEGFSYREAAEILEVPMGTVTSRLARARATLTALADGKADLNAATEGVRA
jgi:RNA polymerase sigma-70 factor (ECF subfamily)